MIVEAAEKAAAGIIEDAETQAHRYIEQSREQSDGLAEQRIEAISEVTDSLLRQSEVVKSQSDDLILALDEARSQIDAPQRQDLEAGPTEATGPRSVPSGAPPADAVERPKAKVSEGARILATQMAVAGSDRAEIEHRLRNEFGIEDAAPILDGILGPE